MSKKLGELSQHPDYRRLEKMLADEMKSKVEKMIGMGGSAEIGDIRFLAGEIHTLRALGELLAQEKAGE